MATLATRQLTRGEEALSIFCDTVARDVAAKNSGLREENAKLSKVSEMLFGLQVKNGDDTIEIDIRSFDSEIKEHYVFSPSSSVEIPHRRLKNPFCIINGVKLYQSPMTSTPKLKTVDDGQVELTMYIFGVVLHGKLKDYEGTLEDVQYLIDTNQYSAYYAMMGAVDVETGQPPAMVRLLGRNALEESTFVLENILVDKALVAPTLHSGHATTTGTASSLCGGLLAAEDCNSVAEAFPYHKNIIEVTAAGNGLRDVHQGLLKHRDIFQNVRGYNYETNETLFQLHLDQGMVGQMMCSLDQDNAEFPLVWKMEPKEGEKVSLSPLSSLVISLGNVPICSVANAHMGAIRMQYGFILKWHGLWDTEAVFLYDDTVREPLEETHFFARVQQTLIPESNVMVDDAPVSRIVGMTVSLAFVQIKLASLQDHLDLLGLKADALDNQENGEEDGASEETERGTEEEEHEGHNI